MLICGPTRPLVMAVSRAAAARAVPLILQASEADAARTKQLCATLRRRGGDASVIVGDLAGDAAARRLVDVAWRFAPVPACVVVCAGGALQDREPREPAYDAAAAAHLRGPFFVAQHAAPRLARRRNGRIVFAVAISSHRHRDPVAEVVSEGLACMAAALARAVPDAVTVLTVVGQLDQPASEFARAVAHVAFESLPSGTILDLAARGERG
jgi:NAD(P)-dependent dehydrogenase (short-subunit alcohol dehydrogenase family)